MAAYYRVNFTNSNNADLRQVFALKDADGDPVDLTGASLKMDLDNLSNQEALTSTLVNGRIVLVDGPAGQFELAIPAGDMSALMPGVYEHDLVLTLANTHIHRVWKGTLTLQDGVTQ